MPFSTLELHPTLHRGVRDLGFVRPTPIQSDAIPSALAGRDLLACASTGSGKTAAFLLPILNGLISRPRGATRALVLAPTRELAQQIVDDLEKLAKHTNVTGAAVYGGVGMGPQEKAFKRGVDVIVATPGRLLDHFQYDYAKLSSLEYLVLDEADRMLDIGFLPAIRKVLKHIPKPKQTLFFSATMPPEVQQLSREILRSPEMINIERKAAPASGVTQAIYPVPQELKSALLVALLKAGTINEALVFTRTKHRADRLTKHLVREGISAERIHGNRSQSQRTKALAGFKNGEFRVLVATDIAARGIDIDALGHVVNLDVPNVADDYIHRVGRTGRASAIGDAFTFVSPDDAGDLAQIERAVGRKLPRVTLEGFDYHAKPEGALEIPLRDRIAVIKARKAEDRQRAKVNTERRAAGAAGHPTSHRADRGAPSTAGRSADHGAANGLRPRTGARGSSRRPGGRSSGSR
ncbi:MAG: DEAD/DEAH box helicase [Gemmatimonadetes bacterium]|nr:DEAD/DEAH box helicase [Gemmatimonadota bacterium]